MKIRNIEQADAFAVQQLIEELENTKFDSKVFQEIFYEYLERKNSIVWVFENSNGQLIGFLSCFGQRLLHHQDWVYEIQEFIIHEPYQNKGYGKLLVENLKREMHKRRVFSLEVTTNKRRKQAHAFYKACGFLNSHEKFTMYF